MPEAVLGKAGLNDDRAKGAWLEIFSAHRHDHSQAAPAKLRVRTSLTNQPKVVVQEHFSDVGGRIRLRHPVVSDQLL
jgi:hypothetical protein